MSSQAFIPSSPFSSASGSARRNRSRFTYKHLSQLRAYSTTCPLRVIAHIDLDAFYAQCEMIRLGVAEDQPLAVQQWQNLIAINYPARKFGLNRHVTLTEAKKLCPNLITQHVATWKEGEEHWAYYENAAEHIGTHKVSLDPYRLQSRKILALIKEHLPSPPLQKVEKAGIDEVFVDLSGQIHSILLERYPELERPAPYDDPSENLPRPLTTALDWNTDALVDLDITETEDDDPDWDDIVMLIGSEVVRSVRTAIREQLGYTCSAGVAHNKMLSKLGSAHQKPNRQTIVRNRAVQQFLSGFKFTKIRNLGGKLGDDIVSAFDTDSVSELLKVPKEHLMKKLGDDTGTWVYQTIRGIDQSEVNSRTQIKSMLSAKSFRPTINSFEQGLRWIRIFVADIYSRLVEEGVEDNKRRPKTINLYHRQGGHAKSRQAPISTGRPVSEAVLFDLAKNLLAQIVAEGGAWPCANLSLSVGGLEDSVTDNRGIGSFLVKGEEAKVIRISVQESPFSSGHQDWPDKKRKIDNAGIQRFLTKESYVGAEKGSPAQQNPDSRHSNSEHENLEMLQQHTSPKHDKNASSEHGYEMIDAVASSVCDQCHQKIPITDKEEHGDWHFAHALQIEEHGRSAPGAERDGRLLATGAGLLPRTSSHDRDKASSHKPLTALKSGGARPQKQEKGQSRLTFGR